MPYTEASASTKSAVASRKNTVSPAPADSAVNVPTPGNVAVEPTAAPLAVKAVR